MTVKQRRVFNANYCGFIFLNSSSRMDMTVFSGQENGSDSNLIPNVISSAWQRI